MVSAGTSVERSRIRRVSAVVLFRDGSEEPVSAAFVNVVDSVPATLTFPLMKMRSSNVSAPSLNVTAV